MDISKLVIDKHISLRKAIEILDKYGKKILIIEENEELVGVLTDGDIRRWILKDGDLSVDIDCIMNHNPKYLYESEKDIAKEILKKYKIEAIPIISKENHIIDVVFYNDFYNNESNNFDNKSVPIVIMAGGKGTRLQPYTDIIPKMLLPIGDIPIIERIINRFLEYNFEKFYISINYKKDIIKAYFSNKLEYDIKYVEEDKPLGTAGSLRLLSKDIDRSFFVTNCDILINANYYDILEYHKKSNNKITIITALKNYTIPYGIFKINEDGSIKELQEKPNYEFLINTGMYILEPEMLDEIPEDMYYDMTDLINKMITSNERVGVYPITEGRWLDMGEFESMKNMIEYLEL